MVAPIGLQSLLHNEGELATARGAAAVGVPMAVSTVSSNSMEDIAKALGDTPRWFQLYWPSDRELAASFVRRAEAAGYGAIALTVDNVMPGWKPRDLQQANHPALNGHGIANYLTDEVFLAGLDKSPDEDPVSARLRFLQVFINPTLTWDDLGWLRERTQLPILVKGILHPDDARRAVQCGMNGVVVSNHGARQVDGAVATLDALPDIVEAVGDELAVVMDSGIRCGADVVKALALGADAVFVGRPCLWGLAVGGQAGVEHVLRALLAEVDLTMALSGYTAPAELDGSALRRV
jgi:isopentenyl diphosphate isomerase/L-lactate dehydrogenase-like FMN-dependent dehydrogenase